MQGTFVWITRVDPLGSHPGCKTQKAPSSIGESGGDVGCQIFRVPNIIQVEFHRLAFVEGAPQILRRVDHNHRHIAVVLSRAVVDVFANVECLQRDFGHCFRTDLLLVRVKVLDNCIEKLSRVDQRVVRCVHGNTFGFDHVPRSVGLWLVVLQAVALWSSREKLGNLEVVKIVLPLSDACTDLCHGAFVRCVFVDDRIRIAIDCIHCSDFLVQQGASPACDRCTQVGIDLGSALHKVFYPLVAALVHVSGHAVELDGGLVDVCQVHDIVVGGVVLDPDFLRGRIFLHEPAPKRIDAQFGHIALAFV